MFEMNYLQCAKKVHKSNETCFLGDADELHSLLDLTVNHKKCLRSRVTHRQQYGKQVCVDSPCSDIKPIETVSVKRQMTKLHNK